MIRREEEHLDKIYSFEAAAFARSAAEGPLELLCADLDEALEPGMEGKSSELSTAGGFADDVLLGFSFRFFWSWAGGASAGSAVGEALLFRGALGSTS